MLECDGLVIMVGLLKGYASGSDMSESDGHSDDVCCDFNSFSG